MQPVGVKTPDGAEVVQPPDYAMYSYDFVNVLVAAIQQAGGVADRQKVLDALNQVTVAGANGDQRGFNERNHEGVVDDDVYFADLPRNDLQARTGRPAIPDARPHRAAALILAAAFACLAARGCGAGDDGLAALAAGGASADAAARARERGRRCHSSLGSSGGSRTRSASSSGWNLDGTPNSVTVVQTSQAQPARRLRVRDPGAGRLRATRARAPSRSRDSGRTRSSGRASRPGSACSRPRPASARGERAVPPGQGAGGARRRADDRAHREPDRCRGASYTGDVEPASLAQVLARIRTAIDRNLFAEGLNVELRGRKTPVQVEIAAPLRVTRHGRLAKRFSACLDGVRRKRAVSVTVPGTRAEGRLHGAHRSGSRSR